MKSENKSGKIYSLAFRKALVDEALNRTPGGGFPELEKRHRLKPGTLFDWVEELGPTPPPAPFSALHFWIGNTPLGEAEFGRYFDYADSYWDADPTEPIADPDKLYNGLSYIGLFDD